MRTSRISAQTSAKECQKEHALRGLLFAIFCLAPTQLFAERGVVSEAQHDFALEYKLKYECTRNGADDCEDMADKYCFDNRLGLYASIKTSGPCEALKTRGYTYRCAFNCVSVVAPVFGSRSE
jgi:hypothetical protein